SRGLGHGAAAVERAGVAQRGVINLFLDAVPVHLPVLAEQAPAREVGHERGVEVALVELAEVVEFAGEVHGGAEGRGGLQQVGVHQMQRGQRFEDAGHARHRLAVPAVAMRGRVEGEHQAALGSSSRMAMN
ncbi:hypothetical protein CON20_27460, partial [Priestia megaterium]